MGETPLQDRLLEQALGRDNLLDLHRGQFLVLRADRLMQLGEGGQALALLEKAIPLFEAQGNLHQLAVTRGKIADVLHAQGELAEPRRIWEEEELPVYEALGDRRSVAVTRGKIADLLERQGELVEARRIREEVLPVLEALGDRRSVAVTRGKIADLLERQGELVEARRIREEEELPVYEALGDRQSIAITRGQIADILQAQGDLAEARRIREEEELPVYQALGDRRSIAVAQGRIADLLAAEGDLDGAFAMHLERLGAALEMNDIAVIANVRFSCARVRIQRGDHEKGNLQTIYEELAEAFAITRQLRRLDAIGAIGGVLGWVLAMRGHPEEAVKVLEEAAAAFEKIEQPSMAAQCRQLIGQIKGGGS